jgi:hypothetical protein
MGSRGRPTNLLRQTALVAGEAIYLDEAHSCWCGCATRYAKNGQCTDCLKAKGRARFAALKGEAREARRREDHERYIAKKNRED